MTTLYFKGVLCLLISSMVSFSAFAAEDFVGDGKNIEVNYSAEKLLPYKQRRGNYSIVAGINVEQIFPESYKSDIDGYSYQELFGTSTIDITQGFIGLKYNLSLGSIGVGALLGYGLVQDGRISAFSASKDADATLEITKTGAYGNFTMDTLFAEPYVAPYVEGQLYSMNWTESSRTGEEASGTTDIAMAFRIGALFQLNWLDPDSSLQARESLSLNNTYLDLFVSFYSASGGDKDLNFESTANYGFGIAFEF